MAYPNDNTLTQAELKRLIHYQPDTGVFTWLHRETAGAHWNSRYPGTEAGSVAPRDNTTYIAIRVNRRLYLAHRLAWLYMTGEWPADEIDHIDRDGRRNEWNNIRAATSGQQKANQKLRKDSRIGLKGVRKYTAKGRPRPYYATITVDGEIFFLGTFATPEEAHRAYREAASEKCGAYARYE